MGQGYFRNVDDGYSDPALIATQYQVGRSSYFEVQLVLAEFADSLSSLSGGLAGSPDVAQAVAASGAIGGGCPERNEYVWIDVHKAVKAQTLLNQEGKVSLYNFITGNYNVLKRATLLKNQPLLKLETARGAKNRVSNTHCIIRNTQDKIGLPVVRYKDELLSAEAKNIYSDTLLLCEADGFGDVIKIELETEFIYASGSSKTQGIMAHNVKRADDDF